MSETGKPRLHQIGPHGQWYYTADLPGRKMTMLVASDGPREAVGTIGTALFTAAQRSPPRPTAPERVYVTAPPAVHPGKPATFWVLVAPRWGAYPAPASDFDFSLGGSWKTPHTVTPDGTEACGGDNIARQPSRRRGRRVFKWGDCTELGLILTPRTSGPHSLTIYGYSVQLTSKGMLDLKHEKLAPGSGYEWNDKVKPDRR